MIKGCQKRMIFVKDTGCDLFEEAYFILKRDVSSHADVEEDIVRTATAIINDSGLVKRKIKKNKFRKGCLMFLLGLITGVICATIFYLFIL